MLCSCSRVCSIIRTDMNWRNSSRIVFIHVWRASMLSTACRMAKNTVFTRRVCGVLLMSVNPCEMSDTQTKAGFVSSFASASSKPSRLDTRQKVKCLDLASLFLLVRSSKKAVAFQLNVLSFGVGEGCCGCKGKNGSILCRFDYTCFVILRSSSASRALASSSVRARHVSIFRMRSSLVMSPPVRARIIAFVDSRSW